MDNHGGGLFGFIKEHLKEFSIGSFLGGVVSGNRLFLTSTGWTHLIGEWVIRLFFTVLIAALSGLATAYAKDLYSNFKATRKQKNIEHEQRKKDKAA